MSKKIKDLFFNILIILKRKLDENMSLKKELSEFTFKKTIDNELNEKEANRLKNEKY